MIFMILAACSEIPIEYYSPGTLADPVHLYFDSPGIPDDQVIEACDYWAAEGISCSPTTYDPDFWINTVEGCPDHNGKTLLGKHHGDEPAGHITIYPGCFSDEPMPLVLAHEIGHAVGIYFHVWPDCETVEEREPKLGPPICDPAIMNEYINPDVLTMTINDHHAFISRNVVDSILP